MGTGIACEHIHVVQHYYGGPGGHAMIWALYAVLLSYIVKLPEMLAYIHANSHFALILYIMSNCVPMQCLNLKIKMKQKISIDVMLLDYNFTLCTSAKLDIAQPQSGVCTLYKCNVAFPWVVLCMTANCVYRIIPRHGPSGSLYHSCYTSFHSVH